MALADTFCCSTRFYNAAITKPANPTIAIFVTAGAPFPVVELDTAPADALCVFPVVPAVPPVVVAVVVVARGLLVPVAATAAQAFVAVTGVYVSLLEERAATQISLEAFWTSVHEH